MQPYIAVLEQVRVGQPTDYDAGPGQEPWRSSIGRIPTARTHVEVTKTGLAIDECTDQRPHRTRPDFLGALQMHGGPIRALYAYPHSQHLAWWQAQIGGQAMLACTFGEQLRVAGLGGESLDERRVRVGDVWYWGGEVVLEVTGPRTPCTTLEKHFDLPMIDLMRRSGYRCGWYFKVRHTGLAPTSGQILVAPNASGATVASVFAGRMKVPTS